MMMISPLSGQENDDDQPIVRPADNDDQPLARPTDNDEDMPLMASIGDKQDLCESEADPFLFWRLLD